MNIRPFSSKGHSDRSAGWRLCQAAYPAYRMECNMCDNPTKKLSHYLLQRLPEDYGQGQCIPSNSYPICVQLLVILAIRLGEPNKCRHICDSNDPGNHLSKLSHRSRLGDLMICSCAHHESVLLLGWTCDLCIRFALQCDRSKTHDFFYVLNSIPE